MEGKNPKKLKNSKTYQDLSEEELIEMVESKSSLFENDFEEYKLRIEKKMKEFEIDYDLSNMKFNDVEQLKALCTSLVTLEDYELLSFELRREGLTGKEAFKLTVVDKLSKIISDLQKNIINMQDSLGISRKIRKSTGAEDAKDDLKRLKNLAAEYYKKVMGYIYCEECRMLITTAWFLYPDSDNVVRVKCQREYTDDAGRVVGHCDHVTEITSEYLFSRDESKNKIPGTNHPEGFRY